MLIKIISVKNVGTYIYSYHLLRNRRTVMFVLRFTVGPHSEIEFVTMVTNSISPAVFLFRLKRMKIKIRSRIDTQRWRSIRFPYQKKIFLMNQISWIGVFVVGSHKFFSISIVATENLRCIFCDKLNVRWCWIENLFR